MLQRLTAQLPEWARPEHPAMRHTLGLAGRPNRRTYFLRLLLVLIILGIGGALITSTVLTLLLLPTLYEWIERRRETQAQNV